MSLSKKELQELIDLVKDKKLPEEMEDEDPLTKVNKFILFFKIKEGKNKVYISFIYEIYKQWDKNPIGKRTFQLRFSKFFVSKYDMKKRYYNLNHKPNQLIKKMKELEDKRDDPNEK